MCGWFRYSTHDDLFSRCAPPQRASQHVTASPYSADFQTWGSGSRRFVHIRVAQFLATLASSAFGWDDVENQCHQTRCCQSARRALPNRHRIWHSLSHEGDPPRFPRSSNLTSSHPRVLWSEPTVPEPLHREPVRARGAHEFRAPSIGLTWHLAASGRPHRGTSRSHFAVGASGSQAADVPPCQGDGPSDESYPRFNWRPANRPPSVPGERCLAPISAVDLMSRASVDRPIPEPSSLHPTNLRDLRWASCSARLYRGRHKLSTRTSASRCRHHRPRVMDWFGAESTSCDHTASPPEGRMPRLLWQNPRRPVEPCARAETA